MNGNSGLRFLDSPSKRVFCAGCGEWIKYDYCELFQFREGDWSGEFYIGYEYDNSNPIVSAYWEINDRTVAWYNDSLTPLIHDTIFLCRECGQHMAKLTQRDPEYREFIERIIDNIIEFYNKVRR